MEARLSIITLAVKDLQRSITFYKDGLQLPMATSPEGIAFFKTAGTCLALYPADKLVEDVGPNFSPKEKSNFSGVTIAHNTRTKKEVDNILKAAENAGAKIEKPAQNVFWGGYSGYFSDPDGHLWEVAYADFWQFDVNGNLILD